ncbi:MAG: hypothetical protein ABIE68_02550 [bacterium]
MNISPQKFFKQYAWFIIISIVVVLIVAILLTVVPEPKFKTTISMSVYRTERTDNQDFQYDNYYAIEASELMVKTMKSWLANPDIVADIYNQEGFEKGGHEVLKLAKGIKTEQLSPHTLNVNFISDTEDEALKVASKMKTEMETLISEAEKNSTETQAFSLQTTDPFTVENNYNPYMVAVISIIAGFLLATGLALIKEFFSNT